MMQKFRSASCLEQGVAVMFAGGGLVVLVRWVVTLLRAADEHDLRPANPTIVDNIGGGVLILVALGLVAFALIYPQLRRAPFGWRFVLPWVLILAAGGLRNLLPLVATISQRSLLLITSPLYVVGALGFAWWLLTHPRAAPPEET